MIGNIIGHYSIIEKIGAGGMGEVYLAEDATLDRKVALKFLPTELQQNETARKRFLREAKSAAALDHPFICKIYQVGEEQDLVYIVMEFVPGETMREKLLRGSLPLTEALDITAEIAEALDKAHTEGIVHRDLKPANIMIAPDGHVKVMDFGLAKRITPAESSSVQDLTVTASLTQEGMTLGTIPYMSPEQVRGETVDGRSDIFALGTILYEMLTGTHPFRRPAPMETASAILSETEPDLAQHLELIPEFLPHIIRKMLAKDPDRRYQAARELQIDLAHTLGDTTRLQLETIAARKRRILWIPVLIATISILTLAAVLLIPRRSISGPSSVTPFLPGTAGIRSVAWDPLGTTIAYHSDQDGDGNVDIYLTDPDGHGSRNITQEHTGFDGFPAFSPDGRRIAYLSNREEQDEWWIYTMTPQGTDVDPVVKINQYLPGQFTLVWPREDQLIYLDSEDQRKDIFSVSPTGSEPARDIIRMFRDETNGSTRGGDLSPVSDLLLCQGSSIGDDTSLYIIDLKREKVTILAFVGDRPRWGPEGKQIFFLSRKEGNCDLWSVRVNQRTGRVVGEPTQRTGGHLFGNFAPGPDGLQVLALPASRRNLWSFPTGAAPVYTLSSGTRRTTSHYTDDLARWIPGNRGIVYRSTRQGNKDIHYLPQGDPPGDPFPLAEKIDVSEDFPVPSRDGEWIIYNEYHSNLYPDVSATVIPHIVRPDRSNRRPLQFPPEMQPFVPHMMYITDWSVGNKLAFYIRGTIGVADFVPETATITNFTLFSDIKGYSPQIPRWSPDAQFLAFERSIDENWDIWTVSVDGQRINRITTAKTRERVGAWSEDPLALYYTVVEEDSIWRVPMTTNGEVAGEAELWGQLTGNQSFGVRMDIDGGQLLIDVSEGTSEMKLIDLRKY